MLESRDLWSTAPPEPRTRSDNWPSVLYSWWCTSFATVVILVRLNGRMVRSGRLFREDWIMIYALIPLWTRMILAHFILIYGTNNVQTVGYDFTDLQIYHRTVGSRLVLVARIIYAAFIWMSKWCVSEFLKRMTISLWRRSYELTLQGIRFFLIFTFLAVVVATLSECQPFDHYWQVIPDPGPQCRQGFAQLITMGTADIITDLLLIAFPIPIVLRSGQPWTRKLLLTMLFSTSAVLIIVTGFRVPEVISMRGRQQYRTVWASSEILASTFVSNFIIIGSFLRDKGTKKKKYKPMSVTDSIDRASTRRPTIATIHSTGSEEDLFHSLGCRLPEHLQDPEDAGELRVSKAGLEPIEMSSPYSDRTAVNTSSEHLRKEPEPVEDEYDRHSEESAISRAPATQELPSPVPSSVSKKNLSFFEVGGIMDDAQERSSETRSQVSTAVMSIEGGTTAAYDFAPPSPSDSRRGSKALLVDLGGFLRSDSGPRRGQPSSFTPLAARYRGPPAGVLGPSLERQQTNMSLQDAGGLLSVDTGTRPSRQSLQSLQDVGGLLNTSRPQDATAAALQRRMQRVSSSSPGPASPVSPMSGSKYDGMSLSDAGGLLK